MTDRHIYLTVTDEGEGIDQRDLKNIMDPFFTTKRDSGGTGLGLAVSYTIVKNHNGEMSFHSVKGKGTTVTIKIRKGDSHVSGADS